MHTVPSCIQKLDRLAPFERNDCNLRRIHVPKARDPFPVRRDSCPWHIVVRHAHGLPTVNRYFPKVALRSRRINHPLTVAGTIRIPCFALRKFLGVTPIDAYPPQIRATSSVGDEYNITTIASDRGMIIVAGMRGQLLLTTAVGICDPEIVITAGTGGIDDPAVRRNGNPVLPIRAAGGDLFC